MQAPFVVVTIEGNNISQYVEKLSYEENMDKDDVCKLTISSAAALQIGDAPYLTLGAKMSVMFGYLGGQNSGKIPMELANWDIKYDRNIRMSIEATDAGQRMKKTKRTSVWNASKGSLIANAIATKHGLETDIDESEKEYEEEIPQNGQDDLSFLRELASREPSYYWAYISREKVFYKKEGAGEKPSAKTYALGDEAREIISFHPKRKETEQDASAKNKSASISIDDKTKKATQKQTEEKETRLQRVYDGNDGEEIRTEPVPEGNEPPKEEQSQAQEAANAVVDWSGSEAQANELIPDVDGTANEVLKSRKNKSQKDGNTASLKVIGNPLIRIDSVITMGGRVLKRHTGNWHVKAVKHDIGNSGYITDISLSRAAQGEVGEGENVKESEGVNKTKGAKEQEKEKEVNIRVFGDSGEQVRQGAVTEKRSKEIFGGTGGVTEDDVPEN